MQTIIKCNKQLLWSALFINVKTQKKDYRCSPTFVNLKSNTMKNTMQR